MRTTIAHTCAHFDNHVGAAGRGCVTKEARYETSAANPCPNDVSKLLNFQNVPPLRETKAGTWPRVSELTGSSWLAI